MVTSTAVNRGISDEQAVKKKIAEERQLTSLEMKIKEAGERNGFDYTVTSNCCKGQPTLFGGKLGRICGYCFSLQKPIPRVLA